MLAPRVASRLAPFVALLLPGIGLAADPAEQARIERVTRPTTDFSKPEPFEARPAGAATVFADDVNAFSHPSANIDFDRRDLFFIGNGVFKKLWVSAPSSTASSDGLGPLFNARSCQNCHVKDGRGRPPAPGEAAESMFLRLSIPPETDEQRSALEQYLQAVIPEPTYGGQLQNFAVPGLRAEGEMVITERETIPVTLADGTVVTLVRPEYAATNLSLGPLHPETMISPRVAPPMIGLGLLEAIPEAAILANADPDDADGDGISGRPNWAWSVEHGKVMLGRFGWKAGEPTIVGQSAHAFAGDMGLSTSLLNDPHGDCGPGNAECRAAPHGGAADDDTVEVGQDLFELVAFYSRNLAVPARRKVDDPQVLEGKKLFYESGCVACHRPKFVTARDPDRPEQSFQLIWPYTDLLLHDMGEGLADNRPEGVATGREWRTAPLWGIGLTETVNGHTRFLHDGRARNVLEAILWHGGEAQASRDKVVGMTRAQRDALLAFVNSL